MEPTTTPTPTPDGAAPPSADDQAQQKLVGDWMNRLTASEHVVDDLKREWQANVCAYMTKVLAGQPKDDVVNVPLEYQYVELKKAQIAFQVPEVHLKARAPQTMAAVPTFQAAVNQELDENHADAPTLLEETTTDVLFCGIAASKIGYRADIRTRRVPVPAQPDPMTGHVPIDPATGQPQQAQTPVKTPDGMLQFGEDGKPVMEPAFKDQQYAADESYFWDAFPAEDLLLPIEFIGSNFDRAPWIGMKFRLDFETAKREYDLPADFQATIQTPRETLSSSERPTREGGNLREVEGYEIWLKAAVFAPEETPLPTQIKQLVLIKGLPTPVTYRDSPYQWIGEDGKLKGMVGFPIHPLTLRFLPGSAYPVSDVGAARALSEEISKGRTQMIQFRNRAMPMTWYDREGLDVDIKAKLDRGEMLSRIGFDGNGNEKLGIIALPQFPRENFEFNEIGMKDFERTWALRPPTVEAEGRTATEVDSAGRVSDVRLDKERTRLLRWFTRGAAKFASLLQQFKDDEDFVEIEGPDGAKAMQAWNRKMVQGEFVFSAKPDSALRIDADVERRQALNLYNLLGKDPNVRRTELLKTVLQRHNIDPGKIVVETPPQEPKPEPPKISFSFKAEDLDNPVVLGILHQAGFELPFVTPPGGAQPPGGQAPHPGPMPQADPLNKHALRGNGAAPTVQ